MRNSYKCPCCGQFVVRKGDDFLCDNCGWDDEFEDRGDAEGIANKLTFNKAKEIVKTGKNLVDGGSMPWYKG